ncbi:hypothetical protein C8K30_110213 [Promicromonospora sp. AC04]|uniref:hypothetical protein n=1 Tax=Promicromonospora sp. AC04 TaxID=2135723 RepID=UPI000D34D6C5|nr:hypothetical protein [Promicromonospora sp. AC04]PUB24069.1 hypothetical protein C8K30_110213 [Promicromonospora sp. AC04]
MEIRRMNRSGTAARALARAGATALGISVTAALALSGCAQSDVGGSEGDSLTAATTPSTEESDMTSPSPSDGAGEDGTLPEAADMEIVAGSSGRGLPPGLEGSTDSTAGVAWAPEPGLLYVVTNGSSSCPTIAEPAATIGSGSDGKGADVAAADGVLTVTFVPPSNGICTMDFVPTTTVVEAPAESDTGGPVPVMLGDKGKVQLQPRSADGEPGPIAWLDS